MLDTTESQFHKYIYFNSRNQFSYKTEKVLLKEMEAKMLPLPFFIIIFIFSQFFLSTSKTILENNTSEFSSSASLSSRNAERLIKSFNLTPKHGINVIPRGSPDAPRLFTRQLDFPATISAMKASSGPSVRKFGHYAGYYSLPHSKSAKMFYFFFESRNNRTDDPVVIWLNGGPGCSSSVALFYENGPFKISDNLSLSWNHFGWDKVGLPSIENNLANLIYVDQPIGTGFSYTSDSSDLRHDEAGVSNDLYDFLQAFFKEHPKFAKNDFYITGESYAGHYIPALASRVHSGNKNNEGIPINLKGFAIGNGLTNPEIQYAAYADYALEMKLISKSDHEVLKQDYVDCQRFIEKCNLDGGSACVSGFNVCNGIFSKIAAKIEGTNYYDVRKKCVGSLCYDFSKMETFLNQENVRKALGVGDIKFVSCSTQVYDAMTEDWLHNLELKIPALIEDGIKLLVYAGEYDLVCSWLGNSRWVEQMNWSGHKDFGSAKTLPFLVDGKEAGLMKNHGPLTFLKVHEAGHMVPMDQPKASLQMLRTWMQGKLATSNERLIKSFNLIPQHKVNVIPKGSPDAPRLVESQFDFSAIIDAGNASGGPSVQQFGHYAGYYALPHSKSAKMFYFFFESRNNNTDPVVIWLSGGPGCSSSVALFYENGPFTISEDLSLSWNDFGWDKVSNLIYVDQPIGTGFSYTSNSSDLRHDEAGVSNDLYDFLQAFFKEHPKFANNDFYITGESYAGHYIPALASRVHSGNKKNEGIPINLKGFAIGNGLTNPEIQYGAYGDYALEMKLISESLHESLKKEYADCQSSIKQCNLGGGEACGSAYQVCANIFNEIMTEIDGTNYYDVRKKCLGSLCYDFSKMETFLNQENVRKALGVGDIQFVSCSTDVYDAMLNDWVLNLEAKIPALVEDGINLLVYAGEYDLICNWLAGTKGQENGLLSIPVGTDIVCTVLVFSGNSRWVEQMKWSGQKDFGSAKTVPFLVDGKEAGLMKNHGPLTFLKVHDAGHMVPMDQPKASLQMLKNWMQGKLDTVTGPKVGH
ncbi:unnamed protein product [Thlaspi arvense]|uniref:Carboxypeptidase n=1 Tax=Thlaspi arvense TaxID=13288 RepID=A0AAU9SPN8_THLAR|nr:unnamed protein product [Thlaspi arvense]